jgi:hypothetical protein
MVGLRAVRLRDTWLAVSQDNVEFVEALYAARLAWISKHFWTPCRR